MHILWYKVKILFKAISKSSVFIKCKCSHIYIVAGGLHSWFLVTFCKQNKDDAMGTVHLVQTNDEMTYVP